MSRRIERLVLRRARAEDVETIVRLSNAGGPGGTARESLPDVLPEDYRRAFAKIDEDQNSELMVAELAGSVVGTFHVTYLTYLAGKGREDCQIEAVHVAEPFRGRGIGEAMMTWAIARARSRGCRRVQLTTNKARKDAHRFYERLGFQATHEGMKLTLNE